MALTCSQIGLILLVTEDLNPQINDDSDRGFRYRESLAVESRRMSKRWMKTR